MNGLDFFKSCTTNVRAIESIGDLQYMVFSSTQGWSKEHEIEYALADLRERNVLCTSLKEELWIFAPEDDASEVEFDLQRYGLASQIDSWTSFEPGMKAGDNEPLDQVLLDAVEGSIAYSLTKEHGFAHVGRFAWAFIGTAEDVDPQAPCMIIRVDANLVENGVLYLSIRTAHSRIQPLNMSNIHNVRDVLIAPAGQRAKLASETGEGGVPLAAIANSNSNWKSIVSKNLLAEGLAILVDEDWIAIEVRFGGIPKRFVWPQRLCFILDGDMHSYDIGSSPSRTWTQWFGMTQDAFRNPLKDAEAWLMGATERERVLHAGTEDMISSSDGTMHANMVAETPLATSPPFSQRIMDQQAALSGIYPTPPDGLLPGHLPQQPTSGGTTGTLQVEHTTLSSELQVTSSDDNPLGASSMGSNGETQGYQLHSDDLFGDMGEMEFGANEVGDADFDYFDEPDESPHATMADEDVDMAEDDSSVQAKNGTDAKSLGDVLIDGDVMPTEVMSVPDSGPASSHGPEIERHRPVPSQDVAMVSEKPHEQAQSQMPEIKEPEKPLSPWGIRRQLLPMIPASAVSAESTQPQPSRRNSTFDPVAFNENLDMASKYAKHRRVDLTQRVASDAKPSIALPQKEKKAAPTSTHDPDSGVTDLDISSEDDSFESTTSMSEDEELPPRLPWDTKKRKRSSWREQTTPVASVTDSLWPAEDTRDAKDNGFDTDNTGDLLDSLFHHRIGLDTKAMSAIQRCDTRDSLSSSLPSMENLFDLGKMDVVYVAQILSEQAVSSVPGILVSVANTSSFENNLIKSNALEAIMESIADKILPGVDECTIPNLALVKEPPPRPIMNPGKAPQSGHPRPLQREGSMQLGPDYFPLPPPFIRVHRGMDTWEMLPPALSFWSALGLGPVSGSKDVTPVSLVPGTSDLSGLVQDFVKELGGVYESRKLGSFAKVPEIQKALAEIESYDDGCVPVNIDDDAATVVGALKAFAEVCEDVGRVLASAAHAEPDRTIVIFIINPFEDDRLDSYLAACFWKLGKAYRQHIPKAHIKSARSDLVLQLLPVSIIAAPDRLVMLDSHHFGGLAMELYDRCPPSSKALVAMDTPSALQIPAAPAVELAPGPPKRFQFHLTLDPPGDLIHEGSILHLAYALSADRQWMAANWMDPTGKHQMATSISLRGKSFQDAAAEAWERTLDILTARNVTWRIFIVSNSDLDSGEARSWRSLASTKIRRQTLHVTLLSVQTETSLQLTAPLSESSNGTNNLVPPGAFLTPGSTPQGTTMTVSPDSSGQAAPPTPAPHESVPSNAENDPDAHLVDVTDESWAMLLAPTFTCTPYSAGEEASRSTPAMARGILFRRGDANTSVSCAKLESLGVNLHWDIRMRPNGAVDEGPIRQGEATLREVLRMYRNLGLLGRAKKINVEKGGSHMVPAHLAAATQAARALSWFRI